MTFFRTTQLKNNRNIRRNDQDEDNAKKDDQLENE